MNHVPIRHSLAVLLLLMSGTWLPLAQGKTAATPATPVPAAASAVAPPPPAALSPAATAGSAAIAASAASAASAVTADNDEEDDGDDDEDSHWESHSDRHRRPHHGHDDNDLVDIGHDSIVPEGHHVDSVVSIFGDTRVDGTVDEDAVSVMGNTRVDGAVNGSAVAVLGNVELGPRAQVRGDVVAVLGRVLRDPGALVQGDVHSILGGGRVGPPVWLRQWVSRCLSYGRPLAPWSAGLAWAWGLALGFVALYVFLALLFPAAIRHCARTLELHPGRSLLAAVIALLLSPVVIVLLFVTVIGIAAVPFVIAAYLCAALFGRAALLAWIGMRLLGRSTTGSVVHPALAVLMGCAVVLVLYLVPVVGFIVYQLVGVMGFGAVVYALIAAARARHAASAEAAAATAAAGVGATAGVSPDPASPDPVPPGSYPPGVAPPGVGGPGVGGRSAAPVSASLPRAGFWIRMTALFIDLLLVGFVTNVLGHESHLHLLLLAAYGAVMWKLRGSTVGGIIFDLQVVRLDGRALDWETAIIRALGCFLSLAVAGLGFIWIAFDGAHQAWHDKIAGTVVVRVPKGVPLV